MGWSLHGSLYVKSICEIVLSECCESDRNDPVVIWTKRARWKNSGLFFWCFFLKRKSNCYKILTKEANFLFFFWFVDKINIILSWKSRSGGPVNQLIKLERLYNKYACKIMENFRRTLYKKVISRKRDK